MAHRSLEETIATIAPSRQRGIPNPPTISVGASSDNGDLTSALSQAGQQIEQLQSAYQQQANLITENTQALQSNTGSHSSAGSTVGSIASSIFGGALGFLSPIISGIASLFGGSSTPAALPIYTPPPPVSINGVLQSAPASSGQTSPASATPATALSPAGQEVAQLQSASSQPPATPVALNTLSVQRETAAHAEPASSADDAAGSAGSSDGALGYLSQIASGIASLSAGPGAPGSISQITSAITNVLGTNTSAPTQLPIYTPPTAVPVSAVPQPQASATPPQSGASNSSQPGGSGQSNAAPQITVNVSAMDSQSFMDRSDDIASAVRAAMLNMHPINDVVADL